METVDGRRNVALRLSMVRVFRNSDRLHHVCRFGGVGSENQLPVSNDAENGKDAYDGNDDHELDEREPKPATLAEPCFRSSGHTD